MSGDPPDHGPRLSGAEFDRRVVALHSDLPATPSRSERNRVRRAEFDLMIDYRLGTRFPTERRESLWGVQERIERGRLALGVRYLLSGLIPGSAEAGATRLARRLEREYASVLAPEELRMFFADEPER
jgi:hypothetical protein